MAESNNVVAGWDWSSTPAFKDGELASHSKTSEIYGDNFKEGLRYQARVTVLKEVVNDGKKRIDLEAECISGEGVAAEYVGKRLKAAFFFPLKSELEDLDPTSQEFRQKSFFPRLFNSFVVACGHPERKGTDKTPLDRMVGDVFEFTPRDRVIKGRETKNIKGEIVKYDDYVTSSLKEVYRPGSVVSAVNEPIAKVDEELNSF